MGIHYFILDLVSSTLISSKKPASKKILVKMKFIAVIVVAIAVSATADDHEYPGYQTNYDHTYQDLAAYNTGYDQNSLTSAYSSLTEKDSGYPSDELDMDVILPIVVFGGLGLGALAFVDSINYRTNLCNKLREVTELARDAAANGATAANLVDNAVAPVVNVMNAPALNTLVNSNRLFINALAAITSLDC